MSANYVPGYKHDVFVSYAHVDDSVPEGLQGSCSGWVTTLVGNLRRALARKLGRADNHSVWMDYQLAGNDTVPAILDELSQSATLIVFLSQGYLVSEWCLREKAAFLNRAKDFSQIFIVEMDSLGEEPGSRGGLHEIAHIKGYRFWRDDRNSGRIRRFADPCPRSDELEYWDGVNDLAEDIARTLRKLSEEGSGSNRQAEIVTMPPPSRARVFLAQVTDDLEDRRLAVKRYLEQHGIRVLPDDYYYDPQQLRQQMVSDLGHCALFVQLLGPYAGKRPPSAEKGFPHMQYEVAMEQGLPVLQWRSADLNLGGVVDPDQRALLDSESVRALRIDEFNDHLMGEIQRLLTPRKPEKPASMGDGDSAMNHLYEVFVNHRLEDADLAEQVVRVVEGQEMVSVRPLEAGSPREMYEELTRRLRLSDAIIWVYGQVPETWVRHQFDEFKKIFNAGGPDQSPRARSWALCDGPPPDKSPLGMRLPKMQVIPGPAGLDEDRLKTFLNGVRGS
jgi:hypothetical protein